VLVALSITVIIIGGVGLTFVQLLRAHDRAQARVNATANARTAIEQLSLELKRAQTTGTATMLFEGNTETSGTFGGDAIDQDGDGQLDEELLNGADDDNDWQLEDDRHAIINTSGTCYVERPKYYQVKDLDDWQIDVDLKQSSSTVTFATFDVPGQPGNPYTNTPRMVTFYVGTDPDGEPNSLMKRVTYFDPVSSSTVTTDSPIAHNVFSFGLLFWDEARAHESTLNPWLTSWNDATSTDVGMGGPASVYMTISVYAGTPLSLTERQPGEQIDTVTLTSMVDIESVLGDPVFFAFKDDVDNAIAPIPCP
jgi:type II secretory pathway pseudopilin PulG